jgi:hypothetical protein
MEGCSQFHTSTNSPLRNKPVTHWTQRWNRTPSNRVLDKHHEILILPHSLTTSHWDVPCRPQPDESSPRPHTLLPYDSLNAGCARNPCAPLQEGYCTVLRVGKSQTLQVGYVTSDTKSQPPSLQHSRPDVMSLIHGDFIFPTRVVGFVAHLALSFDSKVGLTAISSLQVYKLQFLVLLSQAWCK